MLKPVTNPKERDMELLKNIIAEKKTALKRQRNIQSNAERAKRIALANIERRKGDLIQEQIDYLEDLLETIEEDSTEFVETVVKQEPEDTDDT